MPCLQLSASPAKMVCCRRTPPGALAGENRGGRFTPLDVVHRWARATLSRLHVADHTFSTGAPLLQAFTGRTGLQQRTRPKASITARQEVRKAPHSNTALPRALSQPHGKEIIIEVTWRHLALLRPPAVQPAAPPIARTADCCSRQNTSEPQKHRPRFGPPPGAYATSPGLPAG